MPLLALASLLLASCATPTVAGDPERVYEPVTEIPLVVADPVDPIHDAASQAQESPQEPEPELPLPPPGLVESVEILNPDGGIRSRLVKTYDNRDRLIKEEEYDASRELVSRRTYAWKDANTLEVSLFNRSGRVVGRSVQTFRQGQPLETKNYNASGILQSQEHWTYNNLGQKLTWKATNQRGDVTSSEYFWEESLNTRVQVSTGNNIPVKTIIRRFDQNARLIQEDELDPDGKLLSVSTYQWRGRLLVKDELRTPDGTPVSGSVYEYDGSGNLVRTVSYDQTGAIVGVKVQNYRQ